MGIERVVFGFLNGLTGSTGVIDSLLKLIAGEFIIILIVLGIVLSILITSSWRTRIYYASLTTLSVIISRGIITPIIRFFFHRPRPFVELGFEPLMDHAVTGSFPSGHMAFAFPLALVYWMLTRSRKLGILAIIGVLLMGAGRIIVGVHWPLDIIGGIFVGTAGFVGARLLIDKHFPTVNKKKEKRQKKERKRPEVNLID